MDTEGFIFAIVPPVLAIIAEWAPILNDRYFKSQADQIVGSEIAQPPDGPCKSDVELVIGNAKQLLQSSMAGTAALAGLGPTFVSFVISSIAILFALDDAKWWIFGDIVIFLIGIGAIIAMISGHTVFEIQTHKLGKSMKTTRAKVFSRLVYITNILLIVTAAAVFLM